MEAGKGTCLLPAGLRPRVSIGSIVVKRDEHVYLLQGEKCGWIDLHEVM